jgi:hypothetical protein
MIDQLEILSSLFVLSSTYRDLKKIDNAFFFRMK